MLQFLERCEQVRHRVAPSVQTVVLENPKVEGKSRRQISPLSGANLFGGSNCEQANQRFCQMLLRVTCAHVGGVGREQIRETVRSRFIADGFSGSPALVTMMKTTELGG